jgi:sucrose synthase
MKKIVWTDLIEKSEVQDFHSFLLNLMQGKKRYYLRNDILLALEESKTSCYIGDRPPPSTSLESFLKKVQEIILLDDVAVIIHRYLMGKDRIYKVSFTNGRVHSLEEISIGQFLDLRDHFVLQVNGDRENKLKIDFMPFYDYSPLIRDPRNVGKGIEFLNRHMSSSIFQNPEKWHKNLFEFLKIHCLGKQQLLVNGSKITTYERLIEKLDHAVEWLSHGERGLSLSQILKYLKKPGFEAGWGNNRERILETMQLLLDLFEAPDSHTLENFISRIPMVSTVAVISPHGFFGQENVLGRPDTGGQVVYILDQVKALERDLAENLKLSGLGIQPKVMVVTRLIPDSEDTSCHIRLEKIHHTQNCWILRVPFRDKENQVIDYWISRFWVWPYLETFTYEAKDELFAELGRKPDLIIGNYSDGNLVASLLSEETGVIQCNIAHALEKTKYLFSDLYWKEMEEDYHFSLQFTADLLSMNMADFIITSTFQEIAGTSTIRGQYESYHYYSMPGFCQVLGGVNLFHPKFNVISPGVDEEIYFPYFEKEKRPGSRNDRLTALLLRDEGDEIFGNLEDPKRIPLFTMSRLDKIKNVAGLVECFGKYPDLHTRCNLMIIAGKVDPDQTEDPEEKEEICRIHDLIDEYHLSDKIRWLGIQLPKVDTGEIYRIIADMKGVFIQPALFEAFGLTVLEAMSCGLPVFATQFGGPSEIIQHGLNGFLINPTRHDLIRNQLDSFLHKNGEGPLTWKHVSDNGIKRVHERFTWKHYSDKLLKLTKLYGFWRYSVTEKEKRKMKIYSQTLYHLLYKMRAEEMQ